MKDTDLKIENTLPKAHQTAKLHKKEFVMYIYAGKPSERYRATLGASDRIHLADRMSSPSDIKNFIIS